MIQFTLVYNYNKKKIRKDGTAQVQIRAYQNTQRKLISTGIRVTPFQWSKKRKQVIDHPNAIDLNAELRRQMNEVQSFCLEWIKSKGSISLWSSPLLIRQPYRRL